MKTFTAPLATWRGPAAALGLLLFRLHLGVVMVEAGWPKMETTDWFTKQVADLGFTYPSPVLWAWLAAWGELGGGIMLILGLGTRWAVAQLAFQFFVISFLWYDKPEFFTGMYVQQEMFWGFVLLLATGAGRWSLDAWLYDRPRLLSLRRTLFQKTCFAACTLFVLASFATLPAVASCSFNHLHSNLTIEPGKQFLLGGTQRGAFKVVAKNKGTVAVEIKEQLRDGSTVSKATLMPGQQGVHRFAEGSAAVLLNPGATNARLDLTVTGDNSNLRMTTEPARATGKATTQPRLTGGDFSDALTKWVGTLTYLNYGTQKTVTLNTAMQGEMTRPDQLLLRFDYEEPSKKHVFGTDTLFLSPDGTHLRWSGVDYTVQTKQWLPGQTLNVVLEGMGRDDNRAALIRKTLTLSPQQFVVKKEVRYTAETAFLQRNQYQFTR